MSAARDGQGVVADARPARAGRLLAAWAPVALWVGVIFWLSGDQFSDEHTAGWLARIPLFAALGLPPHMFDMANLIVRKCAHFVEYAVLSVLVYRALRASWPGVAARRVVIAAGAIAVLVATGDELHQATTLTRSGAPTDVVLDSIGALAGALTGATLLYSLKRRRRA